MTTRNTHFAFAWSAAYGSTTPTREPAAAPGTNPTQCEVVTLAVPPRAGSAPHEADFAALLDELEASPADAAQLADGRRWVAHTIYGDSAPTLAALRLAAGLSQRQLAQACGVEQPHVSRYESGRHEPSIGVAARLAAALGVDLDALHAAWLQTQQLTKAPQHGQ